MTNALNSKIRKRLHFQQLRDSTGPVGEAVRGVVWAHRDGGEVQLTEPHPLDGAGGGVPVPGPEQAVYIRVFRKRVKVKDINGHPPKPSGQSYY